MARPKKEPTITVEQYISDLAEKQCTKTEIAARLGISVDTLDRRYAEIFTKGRQLGRSKLREKLYQVALSGNVTALIFASKAILGLKETSAMELSGPEGSSIQIDNARDRLASLLTGVAARIPAAGDSVAAN